MTYKGGHTIRQWVISHNNAITGQHVQGDTLITTWTSDDGAQSCVTHRQPGPPQQGDAEFIAQHIAAYTTDMITQTPIK